MSADLVFLDSNIFLYAFSQQDESKRSIAQQWVAKKNSVISPQVINEVSNTLLKRFNFDETDIQRFIASAYKNYQIIELSETTFTQASILRENYHLSYYDSVIVASALTSGCTILCTEDMQDQQIINDSLKINNPFNTL